MNQVNHVCDDKPLSEKPLTASNRAQIIRAKLAWSVRERVRQRQMEAQSGMSPMRYGADCMDDSDDDNDSDW